MAKRLGGRGIEIPNYKPMTSVVVHTLPSMEAAKEKYRSNFEHPPFRRKWHGEHGPKYQAIYNRMLGGDMTLHSILDAAEKLIDGAVLEDPRLVRRSGWVMSEEGLDIDAASFANGDERSFIDRKKMRLADRATLEPVRIVVSTDSREIKPENAAAFIAAAKIAEQFRPLEIWWQGGWLFEKGPEQGFGHIFHVPLVSGDLDFTRLQFVLSDTYRDSCSFSIMAAHAYPAGHGWGGGVAKQSYLPDTFDFVRESGIEATPEKVARLAAKWAGLEHIVWEYVSPWAAEQGWEDPTKAARRRASYNSSASLECRREQAAQRAAELKHAEDRLNES